MLDTVDFELLEYNPSPLDETDFVLFSSDSIDEIIAKTANITLATHTATVMPLPVVAVISVATEATHVFGDATTSTQTTNITLAAHADVDVITPIFLPGTGQIAVDGISAHIDTEEIFNVTVVVDSTNIETIAIPANSVGELTWQTAVIRYYDGTVWK